MPTRANIKEALVCYAIEKALIDHGNSYLEEVYYKLYQEHGLHFVDCYSNPEILKKVLQETFGDSYCNVVELIGKNLGEFASQGQIRSFLASLN